jgi:hypothetical protein
MENYMKFNSLNAIRISMLISLIFSLTLLSTRLKADTGNCGGATTTLPFTDVMGNSLFCQIAAAYFSGLTNGTSATTYSPAQSVTREQMAAFVTRTMDQSLKRGSQRAALGQFWASSANGLMLTTVGTSPLLLKSDGADLWVPNNVSNTISRVRAKDGKLLETWTGATAARGVLVAKGKIFVTGTLTPGRLYQIDPTQTAGAVTTLTSSLGSEPTGIAFDGTRIWIANSGSPGSVSIVTLNPVTVTTVTTGFSSVVGILYDGANIWVTDRGDATLKKLDASGNILQTVNVGAGPRIPIFDGTNIWVPNLGSSTVTVVRAATGAVLATLSGNGLVGPYTAAFDGERILVTNFDGGHSVSLWKAADLTPLGSVSTGAGSSPQGACSDGLNFWITLQESNQLARF